MSLQAERFQLSWHCLCLCEGFQRSVFHNSIRKEWAQSILVLRATGREREREAGDVWVGGVMCEKSVYAFTLHC